MPQAPATASIRSLGAVVLLALAASGCSSDMWDFANAPVYFVKLDADAAQVANSVTGLADEFGFQPIHIYDSATQGFSVRLPNALADEVEALPDVEYVEKDERQERIPPEEEPDPGEVVEDPAVVIGPDETPESIVRVGGPYLGGGLSAIHVAVVDTGIDAGHPDLNVVGEIDIVADSFNEPAPGYDPNGHGTHVAGTIGAIADSAGVVGMAPGVPLHAVRVLSADGFGYWTDTVAGLEYVLDHPEIRVVNMSLGGPAMEEPDPLREAIQRCEDAGVVVVIAAGNESDDTKNHSPANYDLGIVVSAYDAFGGTDNGFAWFTNHGDAVDIAAPGVGIMSTYPDNRYTELDGTSMATPLVAGAVAAYLAENPNAGVNKVRNALRNGGEDNYQGQNNRHPEPLIDFQGLMAQ